MDECNDPVGFRSKKSDWEMIDSLANMSEMTIIKLTAPDFNNSPLNKVHDPSSWYSRLDNN